MSSNREQINAMEPVQQHQVTPDRILELSFGYAPPMIIQAALANGVFDALEKSPKTLDQVMAATGLLARGLRAIMNALVGLGLLSKSGPGEYALSSDSAAFLYGAVVYGG